jgi:hypothetical protein
MSGDCSGIFGDPANGDKCKDCGMYSVQCKWITKQLELQHECYSYYDGLDECQKCPFRTDCRELAEWKCFGKYDNNNVGCWTCADRIFCKKRAEASARAAPVRKKGGSLEPKVGIDTTHSGEYEKEQDRIKRELKTVRDSW